MAEQTWKTGTAGDIEFGDLPLISKACRVPLSVGKTDEFIGALHIVQEDLDGDAMTRCLLDRT